MVAIKGGTFQMGSNERNKETKDNFAKPIHAVTLSDFSIGKTEVTQSQWKAVIGFNPSHFKGDSLPVDSVSWDDAIIYCNLLNLYAGFSKVYDIGGNLLDKDGNITNDITKVKGFRLPTEAEWEYAAGGAFGQKYAGTNVESSLGDYAWYQANNNGTTHAVGTKQPNNFGLYDMSGNVFEWTSTWYSSYNSSPQSNPIGASWGSHFVMRGGAFCYPASNCRVSDRWISRPNIRYLAHGFRLVRSF